jgi:ubiquitin C-terminal hydrolase
MSETPFQVNYHTNYNLKIKREIYESKGLCGLINLGNKCFMNSVLQCLLHTLKLTDYFLSGDYRRDLTVKNKKHPSHTVVASYIMVANHFWDTNQLIKPKTFVESLSTIHRKYFNLEQQDSHECLLNILDIIHTGLSYETSWEIQGRITTPSDRLVHNSLQSWKSFCEKNYSVVIDNFYGSVYSTLNCSSCGHLVNNYQPFLTTSLCLPDNRSGSGISSGCHIKDLFINSQQTEEISDYKCESCQHRGCKTQTKLWKLPNHFIIHLNRFEKIGNGFGKSSVFVDFPLNDLDLTEFVAPEKGDPNNYIYDCYAINYHLGRSIDSGHYVSVCKNLDGKWYNFDDGNVSTSGESLVNNNAYMLFYQRKFLPAIDVTQN